MENLVTPLQPTPPKLPKFLTTVTPFSKFLALTLFVTFPFIGFYLGIKYQHLVYSSMPPSVTIFPTPTKNLVSQDRTKWNYFINLDYGYYFKYSTKDGVGSSCGGMGIHHDAPDSCNDVSSGGLNLLVMDNPLGWPLDKYIKAATSRSKILSSEEILLGETKSHKLLLDGVVKSSPSLLPNGTVEFIGGRAIDKPVTVYYLSIGEKEVLKIESVDNQLAREMLLSFRLYKPSDLPELIGKYWVEYLDEDLGFKIKHPSHWQVYRKSLTNDQTYLVFSSDDYSDSRKWAESYEPLQPFADRYFTDLSLHISSTPHDLNQISKTTYGGIYRVKQSKQIKIGNFDAIKATLVPDEKDQRYDDDFLEGIFFNRDRKGWLLVYNIYDQLKPENQNPVFKKILSTLTFTK